MEGRQKAGDKQRQRQGQSEGRSKGLHSFPPNRPEISRNALKALKRNIKPGKLLTACCFRQQPGRHNNPITHNMIVIIIPREG